MNVEELVRESLHEWPRDGVRPSPGLADRVLRLRRRRRVRNVLGTAAAAVAVLTTAVTVPALDRGGEEAPVASRVAGQGVLADPDHSPPRKLIAAGKVAMSAYHTSRLVPQADGDVLRVHRWRVANPQTGRYDETDWAWLDVAPGLKTAAVLAGPLPAKRIGLLDTATGEVRRWIELDRGVASVQWSPDGDRLLATTYGADPDRLHHDAPGAGKEPRPVRSRTGFSVVEVASGTVTWHRLPAPGGDQDAAEGSAEAGEVTAREDVEWSHGGTLVRVPSASLAPRSRYYEPDGTVVEDPPADPYTGFPRGPMRPDGRITEADPVEASEVDFEVVEIGREEEVPRRPARLLATWADDDRMIVWSCSPGDCAGENQHRSRLLLVTAGDDKDAKAVTLSGYRAGDGDDGPWTPVFSRR